MGTVSTNLSGDITYRDAFGVYATETIAKIFKGDYTGATYRIRLFYNYTFLYEQVANVSLATTAVTDDTVEFEITFDPSSTLPGGFSLNGVQLLAYVSSGEIIIMDSYFAEDAIDIDPAETSVTIKSYLCFYFGGETV